MIRMAMSQRPGHAAAEELLLDPDHQRADIESLAHPLLEVARLVQLLMQPRALERLRISAQFVALPAGTDGIECRLAGEHAGLDRPVAALDPRRVQKSRVVADEGTAGK